MRLHKFLALLAVTCLSGAARPDVLAATGPGGLCTSNEVVLFQCSTGRKTVAICGGQSAGGQKLAVYRYGRLGKVDLEYSTDSDDASGFKYAVTGYSGGGESQIYFDRKGYRYLVYDRTIRTRFSSSGRNDPRFTSGLLVYRGSTVVSRQSCKAPSDAPVKIREAEKYMGKGDFVPPTR
jgi:hypothetical protein